MKTNKKKCPKCKSENLVMLYWDLIECLDCNHFWEW